MTVTIKDVAAAAGVSPKTVSRVMNGEQHVRPAVREAVMRVVDELGYRPNAFARSLSSSRSYLIGLFFDDPASGYATEMQRGALERCRERHFHLLVEPIDLKATGWRDELTNTLRSLHLEGVILSAPISQNEALLELLQTLAVPTVCVSPDPASRIRFGAVQIDEERAAFQMTRHLIGLGHRAIGFVEGDPVHASTKMRRTGFMAAMAEAGLPLCDRWILPGDFSFRSGFAAGELLLADAERPSAIFASNDDMALGITVAALKAGIAIPETLSVVGFDDAPTSRLAWPPLTTVRQPVSEMAAAAIDMLIASRDPIDPNSPELHRVLDYTIVIRGSIAPVEPPAVR